MRGAGGEGGGGCGGRGVRGAGVRSGRCPPLRPPSPIRMNENEKANTMPPKALKTSNTLLLDSKPVMEVGPLPSVAIFQLLRPMEMNESAGRQGGATGVEASAQSMHAHARAGRAAAAHKQTT